MKILKIITGFVVIVLLALIFGGDEGLSFIAISIVCTAGVSLVAYIPLSLMLGEIVFKIFKWDKKEDKKLKKIEEAIKKTGKVNKGFLFGIDKRKEILTLVEYISKEQNANTGKTKIIDKLRAAGWKDDDINKSMEIVEKHKKELFS